MTERDKLLFSTNEIDDDFYNLNPDELKDLLTIEDEVSSHATLTANPEVNDIVGIYLKQIGEIPLLSQQQEIELAIRIQGGKAAKQIINDTENLSEDEFARLQKQLSDAQEAREQLAEANNRLVVSIAKRYVFEDGLPFLDVVQNGSIGLMRAVDKYDPYKKNPKNNNAPYKFSTYATWWIRQSIIRELSQEGDIRTPVHATEAINRMNRIRNDLPKNKRNDANAIAKAMRMPAEKIRFLMKAENRRTAVRLDADVGEDATVGDFLEDTESPNPSSKMFDEMRDIKLEEAINTLLPREAEVIRLRFGFDGQALTLEEVGNKFGLTRERIRQIEAKALRNLRRPQIKKQLKDYLPED